jgi:hypothetical protein
VRRLLPCQGVETRSILNKGVKMLEMLMTSTLYKRTHGAEPTISLRYLLMHVARWGVAERMGHYAGAAAVLAFSPAGSEDATLFELRDLTLSMTLDLFNRFMATMAYAVYISDGIEGDWAEFLSLLLDMIFKSTGVLSDMSRRRNLMDDDVGLV